jgi:hypothetical protein
MTPAELTGVLLKMPPRSAQVLGHRFVQGLSREACAELYGVTPEAWDVLLLRATQDFTGQRGPQPFELERERAAALRAQVEDNPALALSELGKHRDEVKRLLDEAEAQAEASPQRKRETTLRWVAIITIALLSAYFYWQQREREQNQRRAPHPTVPAPETNH